MPASKLRSLVCLHTEVYRMTSMRFHCETGSVVKMKHRSATHIGSSSPSHISRLADPPVPTTSYNESLYKFIALKSCHSGDDPTSIFRFDHMLG